MQTCVDVWKSCVLMLRTTCPASASPDPHMLPLLSPAVDLCTGEVHMRLLVTHTQWG